ncbi:aldose-1-epimerase [Georgenia faecalis]|uniref:Aldose-1-epimerase n=1 Tax=Georgenia faecalis TaxID=2483799 RepID=A0ABV9D8Y9_9MICO|nr:aldose-1-epimerase [Georgenia faecalis]
MSATRTGPGGRTIHLAAGDYTATVVGVGAGLARLAWRGKDVVVPHEADALPPAYLGKTLVPWPNRVSDGRYVRGGVTHELPVNEHATNAALHGLACWVGWDPVEEDDASVTLGTDIVPQYGYPFWLRSHVRYALTPSGLTTTITTTNLGEGVAPYGASSHPYLTCDGAPVDGCVLVAPAGQVLEVDERMRPRACVPVDGTDLDLRAPRPLGARQVDHAYTGLPAGTWAVTLTDPASGLTARMRADAPWVQVYTGEKIDRRGVAVEPMTCPPDAFNSGTDLVELAPGATHTLAFAIDATLAP